MHRAADRIARTAACKAREKTSHARGRRRRAASRDRTTNVGRDSYQRATGQAAGCLPLTNHRIAMSRKEDHGRRVDRLWIAYAARPDSRLREQLIQECRPLALAVLRHLGHGGDEDLLQVAMLGLIKAVDRYDPGSGFRFSSFAVPTIMGEVRRYQRDYSRLVRPPRSLYDLHAAVIARERQMTTRDGHAPTLAEVAESLGVELDQVVEAMAVDDLCVPCSLDTPVSIHDPESPWSLTEHLGAEDPELGRVDERLTWERLLEALEPRLRHILELRYYRDLTQREVARSLGVSQMQVSRLERRAIAGLRRLAAAGCHSGARE
jgi:RNA polymerase sigma-B factor